MARKMTYCEDAEKACRACEVIKAAFEHSENDPCEEPVKHAFATAMCFLVRTETVARATRPLELESIPKLYITRIKHCIDLAAQLLAIAEEAATEVGAEPAGVVP